MIYFGMRTFFTIYFIFVVSTSGNAEKMVNLSIRNNYMYKDLYELLRNRGPLIPHSITSRIYLINILKERYNGTDRKEDYLELIKIKF